MRSWNCLVLAATFLLFQGLDAVAGKIHLSPERLQSESQLIVTGKVESFRKQERAETDGSRTAKVILKVAVDGVTKGDAKVGDVIEVSCWRKARSPRSSPCGTSATISFRRSAVGPGSSSWLSRRICGRGNGL